MKCEWINIKLSLRVQVTGERARDTLKATCYATRCFARSLARLMTSLSSGCRDRALGGQVKALIEFLQLPSLEVSFNLIQINGYGNMKSSI